MSFLRTSLLTLVLGMAGLAVAEKASPKGNSAPPSAETIIRQVDELFRSKSSRGSMEMEIRTPNWSRTLKIQLWTRNMDETFLTIDAPQKDKGVSTLRKGKEMWNYFPKINKVMKVPPSMMMSSWMG